MYVLVHSDLLEVIRILDRDITIISSTCRFQTNIPDAMGSLWPGSLGGVPISNSSVILDNDVTYALI